MVAAVDDRKNAIKQEETPLTILFPFQLSYSPISSCNCLQKEVYRETLKFTTPGEINLLTDNDNKQTDVESMCQKYMYFFPRKTIVVADGITWKDGGNKSAMEVKQKGN